MTKRTEGRILKGIGGFYYVLTDGEVIESKAGGRLRKKEFSPVAGDMVTLEVNDNNEGYILEILPRKNYFIRPPIANIDKLFIAATQAPPITDAYLLDKMSVLALYQNVEPIFVFTKNDIHNSEEMREIYEKCGFKTISCSAVTGEGCDEIREMTKNSVSVFTGNSGVGKSSILNAVFSDIELEVGSISEKIARGKNTTRTTEFFVLDEGRFVADTPGFSSFDLTRMQKIDKEYLMHLFPEMEPYWDKCRFNGCTHRKEPDCAVKQAIEEGIISQSRHESYLKLYEELAALKEWE